MAFPTFLNAQTATGIVGTASVTVTKPVGLAVGDLMIVGIRGMGNKITTSIDTSEWTTISASVGFYTHKFAWKVATAGDVAGSNFTFNILDNSVSSHVAAIVAFTNVGGVGYQASDIKTINAVSSVFSDTVSVTPLVTDSIVVSMLTVFDASLTNPINSTAQSITPATTLIERVDIGTKDVSLDGVGLYITSGEYSGLTPITNFSFSLSEAAGDSGGGSPVDTFGGVIIINGKQNATADISRLTAEPLLSSPTGVNTANGTVDRVDIEPTLQGVTGKSTTDGTRWSNKAKPVTNWTNKNK